MVSFYSNLLGILMSIYAKGQFIGVIIRDGYRAAF